jgi:hypothetical protein
MRTIVIHSLLSALLIGTSFQANAQDKAAIEQKLISEYALTQPTADNTDIVTAGAILVLKKGNVMMAPVSSTNFYQNTYKDGKISQNAAGKVTNALGRFGRLPGAAPPSVPATRTYVPGEKMWVTKIELKDDGVTFDLFTDPVGDVRYKAALKFQFPKGITLTSDQVDKLVAEVFSVQPAEDANANAQQQPAAGQRQPAARGAQQQPAEAAPAPIAPPPPPAETAPAPIAPPPPPADAAQAPPKTVTLGETKDNVVADFGQPTKVAKVGTKEIYFYKDIKVTFVGGKVTDVQ